MRGEFVRFCVVGGFSTALYALSYSGVIFVSGAVPLATGFAFAASLIFSFILQSRFTFRVDQIRRSHMLRYIIVVAAIMGSLTLLSWVVAPLIGEWGWLAFVMGAYPIASYLGHRFYTYAHESGGRI